MKEYEQRFFKGRGTVNNTTSVPQLPITETKFLSGALGVDYTKDYVDDYHASEMQNMWRVDDTLETMIGFRKCGYVYHYDNGVKTANGDRIYTMFAVNAKSYTDKLTRMVIHAGKHLYCWTNFPKEGGEGSAMQMTNILEYERDNAVAELPFRANQSSFALMDDKAYIADGEHLYQIENGIDVTSIEQGATVPIVKTGCDPLGGGTEYQPYNMLTSQFIQTFVADGTSTDYYLSDFNLDQDVIEVTVYGTTKTKDTDYTFDYTNGKVTFATAPAAPTTQGYDEGYAGVKIRASKTVSHTVSVSETFAYSDITVGQIVFQLNTSATIAAGSFYIVRCRADGADLRVPITEAEGLSNNIYTVDRTNNRITFNASPKPQDNDTGYFFDVHYDTVMSEIDYIKGFKLLCAYDNRLFLANHSSQPNEIRWSQLNDPHYFPRISYMQDGSALNPITGLLPVGTQLAVLKAKAMDDATIYLHTPTDTEEDYMPKTYPSTESQAKVGCIATRSCCNFNDTPVFLSETGVKNIGSLSINYERAVTHKSSRVDPRMLRLPDSVLKDAQFVSWRGWMFCNFGGTVYMADSRYSLKTPVTNSYEFEWYPLSGIGTYDDHIGYPPITDRWVYSSQTPTPNGFWFANDVSVLYTLAPKELWGETANRLSDAASSRVTWLDFSENTVQWAADGIRPNVSDPVYYYDEVTPRLRYIVEQQGGKVGGRFNPCTALCVVGNDLYFGTSNGDICKFNTDQQLEYGFDPFAYKYDDREIECFVSTGVLDFGYPHYHKNIRNRGNRVEFKSNLGGYAKFYWEKDPNAPYNYERFCHGEWHTNTLDFNRIDFSFLDFDAAHKKSLYPVRIRGKRFETCRVTLGNNKLYSPFGIKSIVLVCTPERFANR